MSPIDPQNSQNKNIMKANESVFETFLTLELAPQSGTSTFYRIRKVWHSYHSISTVKRISDRQAFITVFGALQTNKTIF